MGTGAALKFDIGTKERPPRLARPKTSMTHIWKRYETNMKLNRHPKMLAQTEMVGTRGRPG